MKHPSGLTSLAKKLHKLNPDMLEAIVADDAEQPDGLPQVPDSFRADIDSHDFGTIQTRNSCSWTRPPPVCSSGRRPRAPAQHQRGAGRERLFDQDEPGRAPHQARSRQRLLRGVHQPPRSAKRRSRSASARIR
jgi:hypothetical protein